MSQSGYIQKPFFLHLSLNSLLYLQEENSSLPLGRKRAFFTGFYLKRSDREKVGALYLTPILRRGKRG